MVIDKMRETHECMAFPCRSLKIIRKFKCLERPPIAPVPQSRLQYVTIKRDILEASVAEGKGQQTPKDKEVKK